MGPCGGGWKHTMSFFPHCPLGFPPTRVLTLHGGSEWKVSLVLCSFGGTGGGWFRWQCSPFSQPHPSPPPSPLWAGLRVLVWSLTWAPSNGLSVLEILLLLRAACGFVGRQAGSISLPKILKKGWDAAPCP